MPVRKLRKVVDRTCRLSMLTRALVPCWIDPAADEDREDDRQQGELRPAQSARHGHGDADDREQRGPDPVEVDRLPTARADAEAVDRERVAGLAGDRRDGEERDTDERHGEGLARDEQPAGEATDALEPPEPTVPDACAYVPQTGADAREGEQAGEHRQTRPERPQRRLDRLPHRPRQLAVHPTLGRGEHPAEHRADECRAVLDLELGGARYLSGLSGQSGASR